MATVNINKRRAGKPVDFTGVLTQQQWYTTTLQYLKEEANKSKQPLTIEHDCVGNLIEGLMSETETTVEAICLVLVEAVSQSLISEDGVVTSLTSWCGSMPHWPLGIYAIARLLMNIASRHHDSFICPYSLRSSPHPFISIFNWKPQCGLVVVDATMQYMRESIKCFREVVILMVPLFKYMFLHPSPSPDHLVLSSHLYSSLFSLAGSLTNSHKDRVKLKFLLHQMTNLLSLSPADSHQTILTLSTNVQRLAELWREAGDTEMVSVMVDVSLAVCCKRIGNSLSIQPILCSLSSLISLPFKFQLEGHHLLCLSWLMFKSLLSPSSLSLLIQLVHDYVRLHPQSISNLSLLILPLVQILSLPPRRSNSSHHCNLHRSASTLVQLIRDCRNCSFNSNITQGSKDMLVGFQPYPIIKSLFHHLTLISSTPASLESWLCHVISRLDHLSSDVPTPSSIELLAIVLSGVLVTATESVGDGSSLAILVLDALSTVAKSQPSISPSLLPLVLYLLPLIRSPSLKLRLLHFLPRLATHKYSVNPAVNVLRTLAGNAQLLPVSLCVLGRLWMEYDSVYPHIVSLLAIKKVVPAEVSMELDLAKALVIRDICSKRGEKHGEEMLSHISFIFQHSKVPLAVGLVTEALSSLCQCDTVDAVTVWSVFGQQLIHSSSVPAIVSSCSILSLASTVDMEQRQAAKQFKSSALKYLWKMVFSQDQKICSAALDALSHFSVTDFLIEYLPPEAPKVENVTDDPFAEDDSDKPPLLPPSYCVNLISVVPPGSLTSLSHLLSSLLPTEVEAIPRGAVSAAVRESQAECPLERGVKAMENPILGLCLANIERDTRYGMVASTKCMMNGMKSQSDESVSQRSRGGHLALKEMKIYTTLMEESLQKSKICLEWTDETGDGGFLGTLSCLTLPRHWALFMKRVCDIFTKVWLVRNSRPSMWDNPVSLEERVYQARDWAKGELVHKLTELSREVPKSSVWLCYVGIVCASVFSPTGGTVTRPEPESSWSSANLLLSTIDCLLCLLNDQDLKLTSDSPLHSLLSGLKEDVDISVILLSSPLLVETALNCCFISHPPHPPPSPLTPTTPTLLLSRLEDLVIYLWAQFNQAPSWYSGILMNGVLMMTLPRLTQAAKSISAELLSFAEVSLQSQSLDYLSVFSSLLPNLLLLKHSSELCVGIFYHLKNILQSLDHEQLMMDHSQIVSLNFVNCCRYLYLNGVVSDEEAMQCVSLCADTATKIPQVSMYCFCLGSLIYGLMAAGHPTVHGLADTIAGKWIQQFSESSSTNEVLTVMCGLAGLAGINPAYNEMWRYNDEMTPLSFLNSLYPLLRDYLSKCSNEEEGAVGCCSTWLLGQIYHNLITNFNTMERVPKDYSYLQEESLLPAIISNLSNGDEDVSHRKCLVSVLLSVDLPLPPCDYSSLLFPLMRYSELQVLCIEMVIKQSSLAGLKKLVSHIFNLTLTSSLRTDVELQVLENLATLLPMVPDQMYLHPLTSSVLSHLPQSQKSLESLLKGIKSWIAVESTTPPPPPPPPAAWKYREKEIVLRIWEEMCNGEIILEVSNDPDAGNELLGLVAECLDAVGYSPLPIDESNVVRRTVLECLLLLCWVEVGKYGVQQLTAIIRWTLHHSGVLKAKELQAVQQKLLKVVTHLSNKDASQKSLLFKTELLHCLLVWTRDTAQVLSGQMNWIMLLSMAATSSTVPSLIRPLSLELHHWLDSYTIPLSSVLQEKILQCLIEWFAMDNGTVHQVCLGLLRCFTSTKAYSSSLIWTTAAHLL